MNTKLAFMKQLLVLIILLSSVSVLAQRKYQFSVAGTTHLSQDKGTGLGVHINTSRVISPSISAGISIDLLQFQKLGYWEFPVAASFQLKASKDFFFHLEPGYIILNKSNRSYRGTGTITEGDFYVFGGLGYQFPRSHKYRPVVTLGTTRLNHLITTFVPLPADGTYPVRSHCSFYTYSLRVGIMLH